MTLKEELNNVMKDQRLLSVDEYLILRVTKETEDDKPIEPKKPNQKYEEALQRSKITFDDIKETKDKCEGILSTARKAVPGKTVLSPKKEDKQPKIKGWRRTKQLLAKRALTKSLDNAFIQGVDWAKNEKSEIEPSEVDKVDVKDLENNVPVEETKPQTEEAPVVEEVKPHTVEEKKEESFPDFEIPSIDQLREAALKKAAQVLSDFQKEPEVGSKKEPPKVPDFDFKKPKKPSGIIGEFNKWYDNFKVNDFTFLEALEYYHKVYGPTGWTVQKARIPHLNNDNVVVTQTEIETAYFFHRLDMKTNIPLRVYNDVKTWWKKKRNLKKEESKYSILNSFNNIFYRR
jgi:hypothetical protein